ncbi:MAG: hypothetical protein IPH49_06675 [Ignavibacteria bacterium]|nr:hypothetical protein [Ignavibacteria bacterium]
MNTIKVSVDECLRALRPFQAVRVEGYALRIDRPFALFSSEAFEDGWFEQMDVTSQRAAHELNARPTAHHRRLCRSRRKDVALCCFDAE